MVTITIDDQTIQVDGQLTILQAAQKLGIEIPTICNDERLKPFCACRVCMVEVDPGNVLVASCHTKVMNNMVVKTNSDWVIRARKLNMELVLAQHPLDCLLCDRGGECVLQRVAFKVCQDTGQTLPDNRIVNVFGTKPMEIELNDDRAIIERDLNKCILCRKCVRICDEVMGVNAVCYAGRGHGTQIGTFYGRALDCEFCGQCVDICPVGALFHRLSKYRARVWETDEAHTVCGFCGSGCSMIVRTKRGELVRVLGDPKMGINESNLCVKGRYGYDFLNHADRLRAPLIRREGQLHEVDWDTAFTYVAEKLQGIKEKNGPDAIAGVGSVWSTNEDSYAFQKLMREAVGTNNIDTFARMEHAPTISVLTKALGYPAATVPMDSFSQADLIVLAGCNVTESHPIVGIAIKEAVRKHKSSLLIIDPQNIKMGRFSSLWLANKPGSDAAVLGGIMRLLLKKDQLDQEFVDTRTEGFSEFKQSLEKQAPVESEEIGGISRADLIKAAELIGDSGKIIFIYGMGLTQQVGGEEAIKALVDLALMTGNIGREGSGIFPVRSHSNIQGACDMGVLPDFLPGYRPVSEPGSREMFEKAWGCTLPDKPGITLTEMIPAMEKKAIKALIVMGEDLIVALPERARVEKALSNLDFLVVSDLFLTETAQLADVVFPTQFLTEQEGTVTNTERRVQRVKKAIKFPGQSKSDFDICCGIAEAMGIKLKYKHTFDIMQEISNLVPNYIGIRYDWVEESQRGFLWPMNPETHEETSFLYQDGFPTGRARFQPFKTTEANIAFTKEYPYNLTAGKILFQFHTGSLSHKSKALSQLVDEGFVGICTEGAKEIQVAAGDRVRVRTRTGEVKVKVKFMNSLPIGTLFIPIHFDKIFNVLFELQTDSPSHTPNIKSCPAQLLVG